jgi:hypothetical protein
LLRSNWFQRSLVLWSCDWVLFEEPNSVCCFFSICSVLAVVDDSVNVNRGKLLFCRRVLFFLSEKLTFYQVNCDFGCSSARSVKTGGNTTLSWTPGLGELDVTVGDIIHLLHLKNVSAGPPTKHHLPRPCAHQPSIIFLAPAPPSSLAPPPALASSSLCPHAVFLR